MELLSHPKGTISCSEPQADGLSMCENGRLAINLQVPEVSLLVCIREMKLMSVSGVCAVGDHRRAPGDPGAAFPRVHLAARQRGFSDRCLRLFTGIGGAYKICTALHSRGRGAPESV